MKKSILIVMLLACACYGQIKTGIYRPTKNGQPVGNAVTLCYEICNDVNTAGVVQPSDFNDANTVLYNGIKPFCGSLWSIYIDPNGTDSSFKVSLWFKPVNPQTTSIVTDSNYSADFTDYEYVKVSGCEWTLNAANNYWYPLEFTSYAGNVYGGYNRTGFWMVRIEDADDTPRTLNRCKINIDGKLEDVN